MQTFEVLTNEVSDDNIEDGGGRRGGVAGEKRNFFTVFACELPCVNHHLYPSER